MPLLLLCHLDAEFASESVIFPFVCAMHWKTQRTDAFVLRCLLKQNVTKARPEDEAMPRACLFTPNHADHAAVASVVDVSPRTCNCQCTQWTLI